MMRHIIRTVGTVSYTAQYTVRSCGTVIRSCTVGLGSVHMDTCYTVSSTCFTFVFTLGSMLHCCLLGFVERLR